jgi:hypothetical protein
MMIKEPLKSCYGTVTSILKDKRSLAVFVCLYVLLLGSLYGFIAIREATVWQVLLTLLFIALAPVLFFLLQAAIIGQARASGISWSAILRASTRLALVTIPVILIGLGLMWLLNRWQNHYPAPLFNAPPPPVPGAPAPKVVPPLHRPTVLFASLRLLIFGVALPLSLIHLWIAAYGSELTAFARGGGRAILSRVGKFFEQAFAPGAMVVYGLGLVIFGVIPYTLLFVHKPAKGAWTDIVILSVRLALVFAFILVGWLITLGTLARQTPVTNEGVAVAGVDESQPTGTATAGEATASAV